MTTGVATGLHSVPILILGFCLAAKILIGPEMSVLIETLTVFISRHRYFRVEQLFVFTMEVVICGCDTIHSHWPADFSYRQLSSLGPGTVVRLLAKLGEYERGPDQVPSLG